MTLSNDFLRGLSAAHDALGNTIEGISQGDNPDGANGRKSRRGGMGGVPFPAQSGSGTAFASPRSFGNQGQKEGVKVHHGAHGEVYELKSGVKLADVMPAKDAPEIPLERWLAAAMLGDRCEDKAALQYANETKSLSGSSTGVLVPESFQAPWVDNLRSHMVLEAAGMTTATMLNRTVTSSRVVSDPPVGWRAEGAPLEAGDPTFELRNLVAKSLAVRIQSTAELAYDSPDFGSQLLQVMGRALAHEVDRVGLMGTGQNNQPRGIVNTPGISTVPSIGSPVPQDLVTGLQRLLESNVPLELAERNAIMSPRTWATMENLVDVNNQPRMRPSALDRMVYRPTTSIPNNLGEEEDESLMILGDFSDLVLGVRMEAQVEALRLQSYADSLRLEFIGWTRVDFMVRRPASFVVLQGVTA